MPGIQGVSYHSLQMILANLPTLPQIPLNECSLAKFSLDSLSNFLTYRENATQKAIAFIALCILFVLPYMAWIAGLIGPLIPLISTLVLAYPIYKTAEFFTLYVNQCRGLRNDRIDAIVKLGKDALEQCAEKLSEINHGLDELNLPDELLFICDQSMDQQLEQRCSEIFNRCKHLVEVLKKPT